MKNKIEEVLSEVGGKIHAARKKQQLTLQELGDMVGADKVRMSKIERHGLNLSLLTLLKVSAALNKPLGHFVDSKTLIPITEVERNVDAKKSARKRPVKNKLQKRTT